jgi:hypothetical protein
MQSSMPPVSPMTSNVNIFNPQMSQMTAMPMMPPVKPVQMMFDGGMVDDFGDFSSVGDDAPTVDTGFDDSDNNFDVGFTEEEDPSRTEYQVDDSGIFTGTSGDDSPAPVIDTRPRTNIRNVGPTSNLRFDPQFTANLLQQRGLDPQGFMSSSDFQQTTQGGGTGTTQTLSTGLPSLGLGQNLLGEKPTISRQDVLTAANRLSDVAPAATVPLAPTSPFFDRDLLDDPLGLGIRTGFGPAVDAIEAGRARARAFPNAGTPVAGLPTIVPGAGGTLPDADPLAGDVISAIRSGAAGLPFSNNPGALKQGQEDLTTEVVKSLPASGPITPDNLAPAIFPSLDAGIGAIDRQLELYARNNINTPEALANTYLGSGNKENSPANRAGYIDAIKSVAGESFNLGNPQTRGAIKNAIVNQEFGSAGANVMADMRRGTDASVLDGLNLDQLALNQPLRSDVNQLGTLDPIAQTTPSLSSGITGTAPIGTQSAGSRGDIVRPNVPISRGMQDLTREDEQLIAPEIFGTGRIAGMDENTFRSLSNEAQQQILSDVAGADMGTTFTALDPEPNRGIVPDTALETMVDRRDIFQPDNITFDPITIEEDDLTTVSPNLISGLSREANIDDANTFRQTVPDAARIFGGRQIQTTPVGLDSIVGDDVVPSLDIADIQGNVNQQRVADILNNPKLDETFKVGDAVFPNLIATLANKAGSFFDRRLFDGIVSKGLNAVVDPDTGRIIGAKDDLGNLIEGRDLEQFQAGDDNQDPVTKFLKKTTEEKDEEDEKPPNVIGGTTPTEPTPRPPTVVKSTAPASTASFTPVDFDAGSLNDLIARITGVPAPKRLQEGGVVNAVDNFLTKVA